MSLLLPHFSVWVIVEVEFYGFLLRARFLFLIIVNFLITSCNQSDKVLKTQQRVKLELDTLDKKLSYSKEHSFHIAWLKCKNP